ncbi:tRNA 5-hydroxyuridine methyltransferase [Streptomyces microflavus]
MRPGRRRASRFRIDLRIAPALDTLRAMPAEPHIDFAYLDADKGGYIAYWEELVPRMRQGGVIAVDNVLFHGGVTDPEAAGPAAAIKEFNEHVERRCPDGQRAADGSRTA